MTVSNEIDDAVDLILERIEFYQELNRQQSIDELESFDDEE